MNCLVTGAAGFIGSTLTDRLLSLGHKVRGVDSFLDYYPRNIKEDNLLLAKKNSQFEFVEADLTKVDIQALLDGVDVVFHQAGQAGVRTSWGEYFKTYIDHNVFATQRLLEALKAASKNQKLVFASSSSVYGDAESYPTPETMLPKPVSPYGVTKLAAEHLVSLYASQFNLPTVSLRYFTVYGPRQRPDMAFNRFCRRALLGKEITVFGDGKQSRDFTFVDDIVSANIAAAEHGDGGKVYNIGGGTNSSVNEVLKIIEKKVEKLNVHYTPKLIGESFRTSADTTLAQRDLKFSPQVSLEAGITAELEWMKGIISSGLTYPLD